MHHFLENIYRARNYILGLDEVCVEADVPLSYHLHSAQPASQASPKASHAPPANNNGHSIVPMTPTWQNNPSTPTPQNSGPPFVGMVQRPQFVYNVSQQSMGSSGYQSISQFTNSSLGLEPTCEIENYSTSSKNSSISSSMSSPRGPTSPFHRPFNMEQGQKNGELKNS